MFTIDDVHIIWQQGKYLKSRGIEAHDYEDQDEMFNEATQSGKPVIAYVFNVVRYLKQHLKRFEFNLFLLRRYFYDEPRLFIIEGDPRYRVSPRCRIRADSPILELYRPSVEFSTIKIVQPLAEQNKDLNWRHNSPDLISRQPRVLLRPPYGVDFRVNAQESIPIEHIRLWMPVIDVAYAAAAAQFFKNGLEP